MKFQIEFWNNAYYCRGQFPDGKKFELKSKQDLSYRQWEEEYKKALNAHDNPQPEPDECQCPKCKTAFVCENRR